MKRVPLILVVLTCAGMLLIPAISSAGLIVSFSEWGVGNFDSMEAYAENLNFASPGFDNFNLAEPNGYESTWNSTFTGSKQISAHGDSVDVLAFDINFVDYDAGKLSFEFRAYNQGVLVDDVEAAYTGTGDVTDTVNSWTYTSCTPVNSVPEPATILLVGCGILGLIGIKRKLEK